MKNKTEKEMEALGKDYFKLNLPESIQTYQSGNGEGIWALTDVETKKQLDDDVKSGQFVAWACNNSVYYPHIKVGTAVLCEFRGENRPVAVWDNLTNSRDAEKNRKNILRRLGVGGKL